MTKILTWLIDRLCWLAAYVVVFWLRHQEPLPPPHSRNGIETPCDEGWIDALEARLMR